MPDLDALDALAGVLGEDVIEPVARLEHLAGVDFHVRGLALEAAEGLVNHDPRVRQAVALAGRTAGEQHAEPEGDVVVVFDFEV